MTALPRPTGSTRQPPDWSMLVEVAEAAKLLGKSEGHLRRLCAEELAGRGVAFHRKPPGGGNPRWWIDRRYDLRLMTGRTGAAHRAPDLQQFSAEQRRRALARADCVNRLREARANWPGKVSEWIGTLVEQLRERHPDLTISRSSLYRWDRDYKCPADLVKLVDRRGGDRRGADYQAAWAHAKQLLLDPREPSYRDVFRRTKQYADDHGLPWCGSYSAFRAQIHKHVPAEVMEYHRDRRRWRRQTQPTIAKDRHAWAAGTCWEGDHRQSNFWCLYNGRPVRPWLTAWMDRGSRKVVGWAFSAEPNSSTILAALRHGLMDPSNFGGPDEVWIDNGKDYDSVYFHGQTKAQRKRRVDVKADEDVAAGLLKLFQPPIEAHFAIPHNPNGNPLIERWFETLEDFDKSFVSYCGRRTEDKPEGLSELLRRDNWRRLPTFEHARDRLAAHIAGYNAATGRDRDSEHFDQLLDGLSPEQYLAEHCPRRRMLPDPGVLDLLLQQHHKPVRVGRNGIRVVIGGEAQWYGQFDPALMPLKPGAGRKGALVRVSHDPHDLSQVRVYDLDWRPICVARANVRTDASVDEQSLRQALREKRAYERSLKQARQGRHWEYTTPLEEAGRQRQAEGPLQPDPDVPLKLVRTPLDGRSEELAAQELRQAAGAEHDELPDVLDQGGAADLARLAAARRDDLDGDELSFDFPPASTFDAGDDDTDVVDLLDGDPPAPQDEDDGDDLLERL